MKEKRINRTDILNILQGLDLPSGEYWVVSGAGLVLHGVKEFTRDVDLGCTSALAEALIEKGCSYRKSQWDDTRIIAIREDAEALEAIENWNVEEIVEIDGFPVAGLLDIRKQKTALGREKDLEDIRLIDQYLAR